MSNIFGGSSSSGTVDNTICDGRLTLTTGVPVTTSDVTGATSVYWTPYKGNRIALWNGSAWIVDTFTEITLALGTVTSGTCYDIFAYDSSGTVAIEKLVWTNSTTRATAVTLQDGVYCKSGDKTRRYLGTFYTTSTTATEDSVLNRLLWNYYNRVNKTVSVVESTATWTYTTATWRQVNGSTANQVTAVVGLAEDNCSFTASALASNSSGAVNVATGVGINSTSTNSAQTWGFVTSTSFLFGPGVYVGNLAVGYNYIAWLEISNAVGTTTWRGSPNAFAQAGMTGSIRC